MVVLNQRTPIRVLHRRPDAIRKRTVSNFEVTPVSKDKQLVQDMDLFVLKMSTQAGTYVKEFIHGDFGRTTPNMRTILGCDACDILALDVEVKHFILILKDFRI